jgi:glycerol transport system ATP-binding protein
VSWPARGPVAQLPDGEYTVGLRPHHVSPVALPGETAVLEGRVQIAELSGSESTIHFTHGPHAWVSQSHGIHAMEIGKSAQFYLDVSRCLYFGADGKLLAVMTHGGEAA